MSLREKQLEAELRKVRELDSNLTFRISIINKVLEQQAAHLIKDTTLTLSGYRVMRIVSIFDEITVSELGRQMHVDRALISRTAAALVKQGYIDFREDAANKRKKLICLTNAGTALINQLAPRFEERRAALERAIGETALKGLWEAIEAISSIDLADTEKQ